MLLTHPTADTSQLRTTQLVPQAAGLPSVPWASGWPRGRNKLAAWPLSRLLLAVFQALQTHLPSLPPQIRPLLTHSVTWDKSLLSGP